MNENRNSGTLLVQNDNGEYIPLEFGTDLTCYEEKYVFVIKYGGHWGATGWINHEKRFKDAKEAYSFYRKARAPKEVGLEYNDGFRCCLSDAGMRRYFGDFMKENSKERGGVDD